MSRKVKINPYTGETLKEPLIVYEDQYLTPEMFYGLETKTPSKEKSTVDNDSAIDETTKKAVKHWLEIGKKAEKVWYDEAQKNDMVNHPHHYQSYNPELQIECIDAMRAAYGDEDVKSFCLCNAFKYLFRCYDKGRNEDIKKCQWYLDKFMELGGMDNG